MSVCVTGGFQAWEVLPLQYHTNKEFWTIPRNTIGIELEATIRRNICREKSRKELDRDSLIHHKKQLWTMNFELWRHTLCDISLDNQRPRSETTSTQRDHFVTPSLTNNAPVQRDERAMSWDCPRPNSASFITKYICLTIPGTRSWRVSLDNETVNRWRIPKWIQWIEENLCRWPEHSRSKTMIWYIPEYGTNQPSWKKKNSHYWRASFKTWMYM